MRGQRRRPWVHHQAEGSNYRAAAFAAAAVALLLLCAANTINYHHATVTAPLADDADDAQNNQLPRKTIDALPVERCFDGLDHARIPGLTGAAEFTISFQVKTQKRACRPHTTYEKTDQWHAGGCQLIGGVRGFLRDRTNWWLERREAVPLGPRENLVAPRGGGHKEQKRREFLEDVFARGSRSDFGIALEASNDGFYLDHLLFGVGHRDFGENARGHGVMRQSARPVRDYTFAAEAPQLSDGKWHDVIVVRARRRAQKGGAIDSDGDIPVVASLHDTSELHVYVDGKRAPGTFRVTGERPGDAVARDAAQISGGLPGGAFAGLPHVLVDAPVNATLGDHFRGCLRFITFHKRALSVEDVKQGAEQLAKRPRRKPSRRPIPMYFSSHDDEGSREMRDRFVHSLKDPPTDIELREVVIESAGEDQTMRFGTKIDLILKAIEENPPGSYVIISDVDIRFFRPIRPFIDAISGGDYDIVFQRDEDRSLQGNLGFMAMRCSQQVADMWRIAGGVVTQKRRGSTGDQRIVNRALAEPSFYGNPRLRWTLFPPELATDIFVDSLTRDGMYGTGYNNWVLFHANRYGRADMRSSRARIAKMNLLSYAESLVARPFSMGKEAPPFVGATPATLGDKRQAVALGKGRPPSGDEAPQTRWQHLATKVAPARRRFPRDTEGG